MPVSSRRNSISIIQVGDKVHVMEKEKVYPMLDKYGCYKGTMIYLSSNMMDLICNKDCLVETVDYNDSTIKVSCGFWISMEMVELCQ